MSEATIADDANPTATIAESEIDLLNKRNNLQNEKSEKTLKFQSDF